MHVVFTNLAEGTGKGTVAYSTTACPGCSLKQGMGHSSTVCSSSSKKMEAKKDGNQSKKMAMHTAGAAPQHRGLDGPSWNVVLLLTAEFHELESSDPRLRKRGPKDGGCL